MLYIETYVLVHWTEENSITVIPASEVVGFGENNSIAVRQKCTVKMYGNCPAKVAGIGKCLLQYTVLHS